MKLSDPIAEVIPREFAPEEIDWAESQYAILNPDRAGNVLAAFATRDRIEALQPRDLAALEKQFITASGWHQARGRLELSEQFKLLAATIQAVRKGREN